MTLLHTIVDWLLVVAFLGAGVVNAAGLAGARDNFVRWRYPAWWCHLTGALEIATAVLIAVPGTRDAGLILGAVIVAAAVLTVLRHRDFAHLMPLGAFVALLALAAVLP